MGRYIIRRLLQAIPLLFLLTIFMFALIHLLPGGPDQVLFNPHLSAAGRANLRAHFGLDDPVPIQYVKWLSRALTGDFGFSFATNLPVSLILSQRFPATLELFGSAFALALVLALVLGVVSAVRQGTVTDYGLTIVSYFGIAMPAFLVGLFLQFIFGVWLHVLPTSGTETLGYTLSPVDAFVDHLEHLILPMIALATLSIAGWSRYMRASTTGRQAGLYTHGPCERRGARYLACAPRGAQCHNPPDYRRCVGLRSSCRRCNHYRGCLRLAGYGSAVLRFPAGP